jgi:single-strand DNA-binding protein
MKEVNIVNKAILIGRLTGEPEVRYTKGKDSIPVANYTLAVDRKNSDDEADFIRCVTFDKGAEFAEKYLKKGMKIAVIGRITTGSYEHKDGYTVYTTEVIVEQHEFCEPKKEDEKSHSSNKKKR